MIDIDNYKHAIKWLRRGLAERDREPQNSAVRLSVLQSFEVTYNLSESILRQAYGSLHIEENAAYLSTREIFRRAEEEGLMLSSSKQWMRYGLALESMREASISSSEDGLEDMQQVLSRFALDLETFALCLEQRLVTNA